MFGGDRTVAPRCQGRSLGIFDAPAKPELLARRDILPSARSISLLPRFVGLRADGVRSDRMEPNLAAGSHTATAIYPRRIASLARWSFGFIRPMELRQ